MSPESEAATQSGEGLDPARPRRTKLLTSLMLNSRSPQDFEELAERVGLAAEGPERPLHFDCAEGLTHWRGLREIHAVRCDPDLDSAFASTVRSLYDGLIEMLGRGTGSERRMAKARRRAADYAKRRCFTNDDGWAARLLDSAAELLSLREDRGIEDWLEGDLSPRPPVPPPVLVEAVEAVGPEPAAAREEAPPQPESEPEVAGSSASTSPKPEGEDPGDLVVVEEAPAPQAPPRRKRPRLTEEAAAMERAADRLYGPRPDAEVVEADSGDSEVAVMDGAAAARLLEQATLLRSFSGWTRDEIFEDLVEHEVFAEADEARQLIETVFAKFLDPAARAELFSSVGGQAGDEYAAGIAGAVERQCALLREGLAKGLSRAALVAEVTATWDVPEGVAAALLEMAGDRKGTDDEHAPHS
jgi:hypothetical protein